MICFDEMASRQQICNFSFRALDDDPNVTGAVRLGAAGYGSFPPPIISVRIIFVYAFGSTLLSMGVHTYFIRLCMLNLGAPHQPINGTTVERYS